MGGNTSRHRLRQPQRACMTPGIRWREISDVYLRNTWSIGRYEGRPAALFEARDCRRPGQHAGLGGQCLILPTPAGCSCGRADAFQSAGLPDLRPPGACVYRLHTGIPLAGRRVPAGRPDAFHPAGLAYLRPPGTCAYRLHTGIPLARCRVPAGRPELRAAQHRGGLADTATMGQAMPTGSRCLLPAGHLIGIGATGVDLDEGLISACGRLGPVFTLAGGSELSNQACICRRPSCRQQCCRRNESFACYWSTATPHTGRGRRRSGLAVTVPACHVWGEHGPSSVRW